MSAPLTPEGNKRPHRHIEPPNTAEGILSKALFNANVYWNVEVCNSAVDAMQQFAAQQTAAKVAEISDLKKTISSGEAYGDLQLITFKCELSEKEERIKELEGLLEKREQSIAYWLNKDQDNIEYKKEKDARIAELEKDFKDLNTAAEHDISEVTTDRDNLKDELDQLLEKVEQLEKDIVKYTRQEKELHNIIEEQRSALVTRYALLKDTQDERDQAFDLLEGVNRLKSLLGYGEPIAIEHEEEAHAVNSLLLSVSTLLSSRENKKQ